MSRYGLPDEAWTLIQPLLPAEPAIPRVGRPSKTVYNRFNRWSQSGVINIIFNKLLSSLDAHGLADWSATALDGSNIRALRCAAGAQKNIPISPEITAWVALAAVLAPKSIWQQTEWSAVKHFAESRASL